MLAYVGLYEFILSFYYLYFLKPVFEESETAFQIFTPSADKLVTICCVLYWKEVSSNNTMIVLPGATVACEVLKGRLL